MKKILLLLGLLFVIIGYSLISTVIGLQNPDLPNVLKQQGIISQVEIHPTPKFGEVFYFELEGIKTRFWLKSKMQAATKERMQQEVQEGDLVTVYYTSLEGTQYDYSSAPFSVIRLENKGKTIVGLDSLNDPGTSTFMTVMLSAMGGLFLLIGTASVIIVIRAWLKGIKKH